MVTDEKVLEKVRKLLALATSPNEHEAATAAAHAQALLTKYNLDLADLGKLGEEVEKETGSLYIETGVKWNQPYYWMVDLARATADVCYCKYLLNPHTRSFIFIGTPTDTAVAKEMFFWLKEQIERLAWADEKEKNVPNEHGVKVNPKRYRTSFMFGCATRVAGRLYTEVKGAQVEGTAAIVKVTDAANQAYITKVWPKLKAVDTSTRSDYGLSHKGYEAGRAAGDKVHLNPQRSLEE